MEGLFKKVLRFSERERALRSPFKGAEISKCG
jgi:hypothetical protein